MLVWMASQLPGLRSNLPYAPFPTPLFIPLLCYYPQTIWNCIYFHLYKSLMGRPALRPRAHNSVWNLPAAQWIMLECINASNPGASPGCGHLLEMPSILTSYIPVSQGLTAVSDFCSSLPPSPALTHTVLQSSIFSQQTTTYSSQKSETWGWHLTSPSFSRSTSKSVPTSCWLHLAHVIWITLPSASAVTTGIRGIIISSAENGRLLTSLPTSTVLAPNNPFFPQNPEGSSFFFF